MAESHHEEPRGSRTISLPSSDRDGTPSSYGDEKPDGRNFVRRLWDSFKVDPDAHSSKTGELGVGGKVFDVEGAAMNTASSPLRRELKGRHLQMIAIGGSIGKHLFPSLDPRKTQGEEEERKKEEEEEEGGRGKSTRGRDRRGEVGYVDIHCPQERDCSWVRANHSPLEALRPS